MLNNKRPWKHMSLVNEDVLGNIIVMRKMYFKKHEFIGCFVQGTFVKKKYISIIQCLQKVICFARN